MRLFNYNKKVFGILHPSHPILNFIGGFVSLVDGIITISTLGLVMSSLKGDYYGWIIKNRCRLTIVEGDNGNTIAP